MRYFASTREPEPHRRRRHQILTRFPEIKSLMGFDRWTSVVGGLVCLAQIGLAIGLNWAYRYYDLSGWLFWTALLVFSYLIGAILSHWLSMVIHEATHNLAARSPGVNIAISMLCSVPLLVPAAMSFRRYHLAHHAQLGELPGDTDLPLEAEVRYCNTRLRRFIWLFFYSFVYAGRSLTFMSPPNRLEKINILVHIVVWMMIYPWVGWIGATYLFFSMAFGHSLHPVAAHFIHEHYVIRDGQETYSYYGPLNKVTFNVGYHVEHHDIPNIPGRNLPRLKEMAHEFYRNWEGHRSWTWVLWHFVTGKSMGLHRRIVRPSP